MTPTRLWAIAALSVWASATAAAGGETEPGPTLACKAMATRVAAATGGKLGPSEGEGYGIAIAGLSSAYYGCAEGAVGFTADGKGSGPSPPVAKAIGAAALAIAGRDDPALRRGLSACMKAAAFVPYRGKARAIRTHYLNNKKRGETIVGGLRFTCLFFTDASEPPVFFVGPR